MNLEPIKVLDHGYVQYVTHWGDDLLPLEAARMSTGNPTGVNPTHDDGTRSYLYRNDHATPFEMAGLQLEAQAPIFVAREIFRHRVFSFNEFSGRYAVMPDLCYLPDSDRVKAQHDTKKQGSGEDLPVEVKETFVRQFADTQEAMRLDYEWAINEGIAREVARINIPLAQYTRFRMQGTLRGWLGFFDLRLRPDVQPETRAFAEAMASIVADRWPKTWALFEEHTLHAVKFSRKEMEVLRSLIDEVYNDHTIVTGLIGPKARDEFFRKLNLI